MPSCTRTLRFLVPVAALAQSAALADVGQPECAVPVVETPSPIPLPYGCHTTGAQLGSTVDSDTFSFTGEAGDVVRVLADQISNNCMGIKLDVFGPNGFHETTQCQPSCNPTNSCSVGLVLDLVDSGDYVIVVMDPGSDQSGSYTLQVERIAPFPDVPALALGVTVAGQLSPTTDQDYFPFHGEAGSLVSYSVDQTSNNCVGLHLEIFDPTGASILDVNCQPSCNPTNSCSLSSSLMLGMTGEYLAVLSDPGLDQSGTYNVTIGCILGCPVLTSSLQYNGSGVNPLVYDSACPPVLGGTWVGEVDTNGTSAVDVLIFSYAQSLNPGAPFLNFGELLVDTSSPQIGTPICCPIEADGFARCRLPVPNIAALAGFTLTTQAAIVGPPRPQLTNALELRLGY